MKILITGGTGFVGFHCVKKFIEAGHDVRLLVRTPAKLPGIYQPHGIEIVDWVEGDMTDPDAVDRALDGCDAVLHAAATFYGGDEILDANIKGVHNVVGGAHERGIDPILYVSSIGSMFPGVGEIMTVEDPIASFETTYGQSKAEGERYARELQSQGAPLTILYPAGVYGPDDPVPGETTKGLRDTVAVFFPITAGGIAIIDVRDLAEVAVRACVPGRGSRRYMAGGHYLTWEEYASICDEVTGRRGRKLRIPGAAVLGAGRILDWIRKLVPIEYPLTYEAAQYIIHLKPCDSRPTCEELGLEFRPTSETLRDAIRWLHDAGHVSAAHAGKLAE